MSHIAGLEIDSVDLDEEVGDASRILLKPVGALLLDVVVVVVVLKFGKVSSHGFKCGVGRGKSHLLGSKGLLVVALHASEAELRVVGFVESHLGDLFCQIESHFRG